jgi:hypothetical protein
MVSNSQTESEWERKCADLERAFRKLSIKKSITKEELYIALPGICHQLIFMAPKRPEQPPLDKEKFKYFTSYLGSAEKAKQLMRALSTRYAKPSPDKRGLRNLATSLGKALKEFEQLSDNALDALNYKPAALKRFQTDLRALYFNAMIAKPLPRRGAPEKIQAQKIARFVAKIYFDLTGTEMPANAKLLSEIFEILGIDASSSSQGKKAKSLSAAKDQGAGT